MPLIIIKDAHSYAAAQSFSSVVLYNKAEVMVHATRAGLSPNDSHSRVSYRRFGYVSSSFPASSNIIDNVRSVSRTEVVYRDPAGTSGKFLRPEQKPRALLRELMARFSQPGDTVVDPFCDTMSVACAALTMRAGQYQRAVVADADAACVAASWPTVRTAFVGAVLQGSMADHVDASVVAACRVLAEDALRRDLRSRLTYQSQAAMAYALSYTAPAPSLPRPSPYTISRQVPAGQPAHSGLPPALLCWLANQWAAPRHASVRPAGGVHPNPTAVAARPTLLQQLIPRLSGVAIDRWPLEHLARLQAEDFHAM